MNGSGLVSLSEGCMFSPPVGFLHVFWLQRHAFGKLALGENVCLFLAPGDELVT